MSYPKQAVLTEVGPRDGLQNEKRVLPTADKIAFIEALAAAGCTRIETTSFVSPKWVPQMGDAAEIYRQLRRQAGVKYIALVPNEKGMQNALDAGVTEFAVFTAASESFTKRNINRGVDESLADIRKVIAMAPAGSWIRGYISTGFGCPYEGKVPVANVLRVARRLLEMGVHEISIGDTIGVATPNQVEELSALLLSVSPADKIALHFHDTRGTALANVLAGLASGIFQYDSSAGGLGGCPYAPGASGNLATEDLLYMLDGMGIATGIKLPQIIMASIQVAASVGRSLPSKYLQAHLAKLQQRPA